MARTLINGAEQITPGTVTRPLINTGTAGSSLITKVLAGSGISIAAFTGADSGTGDVTLSAAVATTGPAIIDFGTSGGTTTFVAVTGQTGITANSEVNAWLVAVASADHSADEHLVENMTILAGNIVPGAGFTIYAATNGLPLFGKWSVQWLWN